MALVKSTDTVRGEYTSGTGWEAGNAAPSTKYIDENGKVTDDEPTGVSRVLVAAGDVVRPHMVEALKAGSTQVAVDFSNANSPGDSSHSVREPLDADETDGEPAKPAAKRGRAKAQG